MLHNLYFSAKGTTELCAQYVGASLQQRLNTSAASANWCAAPLKTKQELAGNDLLLFSMPVYGGFIPHICAQMAANLQGNNTPAVIMAVYGNRHYDNALLQMKDILSKQGFQVIAAGAFLAEHSIFPAVAAGRPNEQDKQAMAAFAAKCGQLLEAGNLQQYAEIKLPGNPDYDAASFKGVPLKPNGDKTCVKCHKCVEICPQQAISAADPRKTNASLCISCGACIKACPVGSRNYHGVVYKTAEMQFKKKCAAYRSPETFYICDK